MDNKINADRHNRYAPWWAIAMSILLVTGLSTIWFNGGNFWKGYVLDMVGPAWNYILIRGLFTAKQDNRFTRLFTPATTLLVLLGVAFGIETMQYFRIYEATYDPLDFAAYSSIIVPLFIIDMFTQRTRS
jgi:hypothetical protein